MTNTKAHSKRIDPGASVALTAALFAVGALTAQASTDYAPAIWRPTNCTKWNTSGYGHKFHVCHDMEGYYAYEVSSGGGLRSCGVSVSVHYAINGKQDASSDYAPGEVTQYVREAYYAWHACCWNGHSTGVEHEGFRSNPAWFTEPMYVSSASLARHLADKFGFAKDRNHIVGHDAKSSSAWCSYASANFGINAYCNTHDDPGPYWNWSHLMSLINGGASLVDGAQWISQSVGNDTVFAPGQGFTCVFNMKNSGTTTWTTGGYTMNRNGGTDFANNLRNNIANNVGAGGSIAISVPMTAPSTPGTYTQNLQMNNTDGVFFGAVVSLRIIVSAAPTITTQPWAKTVDPGGSATFTVAATGNSLSYQWKKNGVAISGANGTALALSNIQLSDAGFYTVTVSSPGGSVTSQEAQLVVTSTAFPAGDGTGLNGKYYNNVDFTDLRIDRTDAVIDFNWGTDSPNTNLMWVDTYSIRWTGFVQPRYTQNYTFYTRSDDGVRLWVNGQLLIDKWIDQGGVEWSSSTISLTAGQRYAIQLDYYENAGGSMVQLLWSAPSVSKAIIPQTQLSVVNPPVILTQPAAQTKNPGEAATFTVSISGTAPFNYQWKKNGTDISGATDSALTLSNVQLTDAGFYSVAVNNSVGSVTSTAAQLVVTATPSTVGTGSGLSANYYGTTDFNDLRLSRVDGTVNFDWGTGSPDPSVPADSFSVRWAGQVEPRYSQTYTFYTLTDDGVRLWVNGQLLIDKWIAQAPTEYSATITLTAGQKYDIQMDYYEYTAGAVAKLYWSAASLAKEIVPQTQLYRLKPILSTIGNKTVNANQALTFTASATNPNHSQSTNIFATWEGSAHGTMEVMFRKPANSGTTTSFIDTAYTNYAMVVTGAPSGVGGTKALKTEWTFKTGQANQWIRLTTASAPSVPNPTIALDQICTLRIYSSKALKVGLGCRETATTAAYGADGGLSGTIDWAGVTNVVGGCPVPNKPIAANTWTTVNLNIPFEPQASFTGDGKVDQSGAKGVLEHLVLRGEGGSGNYVVYLDDVGVVDVNDLAYTLDAGAPTGAAIERRTGKFSWTPTSGQAGMWNITVRVTDRQGAVDYETIAVTVDSSGNNAPVLAAISNKTVDEMTALSFAATATDIDPGQTLTYSLDAGAPAGASINASSGAFTWTPTEAQGPGSYPVTIRVTDNGSPVKDDAKTFTINVNEANVAPVLAAMANQTIDELATLSITAIATDSDIPANIIEYSVAGPNGISINPSTGAIGWTPTEAQGPGTYAVDVTAVDGKGGSNTKTFTVTVNEVNTAPVLNVNTTATTIETITDFESFEDSSYNGTIMFRQPAFSGSTSTFLDSAVTNFSSVTTSFPAGANCGVKVLRASFAFQTGATNPWLRLLTTSTSVLPNPIVKLNQRVRFDIYVDKAIKLGLGLRETGSGGNVGENGGTTGTIEWAGVTSATAGCPNPTRTIAAGSWQTVEFNLPSEPITPFTGDGVLSSPTMKGVLEHLAVVPAGGMGAYNLYLDNFQVVTVSTNLVVDTGATLTFANITATDADLPAQTLNFSLDAGAPTNATIDAHTGVFTWTPTSAQGPSTNVITIRVTDNGPGNLSASQAITIIVNKINTPPKLDALADYGAYVEMQSGQTVTFTAVATDNDVPAQTLTFSLQGTPPSGATIDPATGVFNWTPPTSVASTNRITVRVTDNGVPPLYDEKDVTIYVIPTNAPPVLGLGTARATETVAGFESFTNGTPTEQVMFKKPANSTTTSSFIDTAVTNYTTVTTVFPAGNGSAAAKVLRASWSFKTGTSNYWVRLNTYNTTFLPNPAINASARLKFDIYSTKSLKVALGIRETGTTAENGANGGTTGTIEYVGVSGKQSNGCPIPTRTVNASTWTTLEFDLPNDPKAAFTGDGILNGGQQVLEQLALVGNGGTGAYDVYLDNFQVVTITSLPGTVTMKANSTLTFTASATDPDPGSGLNYGLDADAPAGSSINMTTGAFTWTPTAAGTSSITVFANDNPTNGGIIKTDSKTVTVVVNADTLGAQSSADGSFVAGGDTVALSWESVPGALYQVQQLGASGEWAVVQTVSATGENSSVSVTNNGNDGYFRIVEVGGGANE